MSRPAFGRSKSVSHDVMVAPGAEKQIVKTGAVSGTIPPPAPFDARVEAKAKGNEITWNSDDQRVGREEIAPSRT